jgi:cobalt-zinc-cadmium efflux system membrane fusion protein
MNTFKITRAFFISSIACVLLSCGSNQESAPEEAEKHKEQEEGNLVALTFAQSKNAGIELGKVEPKQISGTIKVNGLLDVPPQQLVSISVPLGGFIKHTSLLQGSKVKKGQVIAIVENLDFIQIQQDYLEAKGQLELTKLDYERQQRLAKENVNSQKTLQQSKTTLSTWQAKYNGLREKLKVINLNIESIEKGDVSSSIHLYSPINGYVTEVNVNIGKFVNPSDVLFEIVDTEHLHAELIVFEKDVLKIKIGQKVRFTLANETKERMATVYLIGREIREDRTVRIHCHIDTEDKELLPGMYLSALVETGGALVPALPNDAVISYQGRKYIFMLSEDIHQEGQQDESTNSKVDQPREESQHFSMVEIQTSNSELGYTEVTVPDSLSNSQIVIKGAYSILSKMKNSEEEGGGHAH